MQNSIEVNNVTMSFKRVNALKDFSVTFEGGKIYGLLGRNGAGKTTLLNVINNRLIPTAGAVQVDGMPICENDKALAKIYYIGEKQLMPEEMKVKNYFDATACFYGFDMPYANRLAASFGLNTSKKLKSLSTGYSTIAKLITALACDAEYLLLDEPVLGLDANHRELFYRELLENYAKKPRTIILSTHLIEEISRLIEQVVIIKNGTLLLFASAEEMLSMGYSVSGKADEVDAYCADKRVLSSDSIGALKTVCVLGKPQNVSDSLEVTALDMQKLFIHLTNN